MVSTNFRESAFFAGDRRRLAGPGLDLPQRARSRITTSSTTTRTSYRTAARSTRPARSRSCSPDDTTDGAPVARFQIDDVHKELGAALREISSAATIRLRVVLASDPDTVEEDFGDMELQDARVTLTSVTGRIGVENINQEPFPAEGFSPSYFAGLYQ